MRHVRDLSGWVIVIGAIALMMSFSHDIMPKRATVQARVAGTCPADCRYVRFNGAPLAASFPDARRVSPPSCPVHTMARFVSDE